MFFPNSRLPLFLLLKIPSDPQSRPPGTTSNPGCSPTRLSSEAPPSLQQKMYLGGGEGHPWQGSPCPASRPALASPVRTQRQHPPEVPRSRSQPGGLEKSAPELWGSRESSDSCHFLATSSPPRKGLYKLTREAAWHGLPGSSWCLPFCSLLSHLKFLPSTASWRAAF